MIVSALALQDSFTNKAGPEILKQMYTFPDKKGRPICLIPEVTAIIQEQWRDGWSKAFPKPSRLFYIQRCYRYERPQKGRYREFTQCGIEILGGGTKEEALGSLRSCLDLFNFDYSIIDDVQRGLSYYTEKGFEAIVPTLGAQEQIAGGGRYPEGIGWAIGIERLILAKES